MPKTDFSDQLRNVLMLYKRIGYNLNVMRQSLCLVLYPNTVNNIADLFNCTPVDAFSSYSWNCRFLGSKCILSLLLEFIYMYF